MTCSRAEDDDCDKRRDSADTPGAASIRHIRELQVNNANTDRQSRSQNSEAESMRTRSRIAVGTANLAPSTDKSFPSRPISSPAKTSITMQRTSHELVEAHKRSPSRLVAPDGLVPASSSQVGHEQSNGVGQEHASHGADTDDTGRAHKRARQLVFGAAGHAAVTDPLLRIRRSRLHLMRPVPPLFCSTTRRSCSVHVEGMHARTQEHVCTAS